MIPASGIYFGAIGLDFAPDRIEDSVPAEVGTKHALLETLAGGLEFPGWFGHNWDALEDCLRDLHWLEPSQVVISHQGLPLVLEPHDLPTYVSILVRAAELWTPRPEHELVVVFREDDEPQLRPLLGESHADPVDW